jgi:hypothetical protein
MFSYSNIEIVLACGGLAMKRWKFAKRYRFRSKELEVVPKSKGFAKREV